MDRPALWDVPDPHRPIFRPAGQPVPRRRPGHHIDGAGLPGELAEIVAIGRPLVNELIAATRREAPRSSTLSETQANTVSQLRVGIMALAEQAAKGQPISSP